MTSYYGILGVDSLADQSTIKKAYLNKIKQYHPDSGHKLADSQSAAMINQAYSVLSHQQHRRNYDQQIAVKPTSSVKPTPNLKPTSKTTVHHRPVQSMTWWSSIFMLGLWCVALVLVYLFQNITITSQAITSFSLF